jgi:hypothetical protein
VERGFGESEERAGIEIPLANLNELDAIGRPAAHPILQPVDLRGVYMM